MPLHIITVPYSPCQETTSFPAFATAAPFPSLMGQGGKSSSTRTLTLQFSWMSLGGVGVSPPPQGKDGFYFGLGDYMVYGCERENLQPRHRVYNMPW